MDLHDMIKYDKKKDIMSIKLVCKGQNVVVLR
jgi:hypothetical protein